MQTEREKLLASNRRLAEENLSLQPQLEYNKQHLAGRYKQLEKMLAEYQESQCRMEKYQERCNPKVALAVLRSELDNSEDESEGLMEEFLQHNLPLETFLAKFQNARKISHIRRTQFEKLQELIKKDEAEQSQQQQSRPPMANQPSSVQTGPLSSHNGAVPRFIQLRYGFTPAILIPSQAVAPFPVPAAPPSKNLPPLVSQPGQCHSSRPATPYGGQSIPCSGLRLIGHIPVLAPRPFKVQQLHRPPQSHQRPPYR
ncbi:vacuolar protein sorting-associated protein 37D [Protopterus annectens]|uniref:vacuolar protein sorting-associated protein 37D n=1 Tax=Protopterus annectens TaxID=7888 RepID=UPI001CFAB421|nr:vacuolar protein sorting-associated protein 37D [Protopterus annectens]